MPSDDLTMPLASGAGPEHPPLPPLAAASESLTGRTIGPYRILSKLGEGGFGSVYLADQSEPVRRRVALKVIKAGMDSRSVMSRFEAERQALALMDHPGVAKVFDAGTTDQHRPYFVMEYVPGEPITRFCEQERLAIAERVKLMIHVCAAVQHAHMKGIIHRDLKPSNILVELLDGAPAPKIIDFGVAKALRERLSESTVLTERGQMVGTPEYMSPEQARGSAVDIDTRSDVYSLGAILYELLTGKTPFESRELREAGYAGAQRIIEESHPPRPSDRVASAIKDGTLDTRTIEGPTLTRRLRGDLDWIVMRCLEKERSRRYDSAGALARDLERYLGDEPVDAGPPSAGYRAAKFVRRHRAGVAAAGVAIIALSVGAAAAAWGYVNALAHREQAEAEALAASRARDEAEIVTSVLSTMLESAAPEESGPNTTVREVLDRASLSIGTELAGRPLVEARLRHTMGNAYKSLGLNDQAERHLTHALDLRRRELGEDHPETLRIIANVAGLRHHQGRYDEAERLIKQALAIREKAGRAEDADSLGLLNNLAQTYSRQGRVPEALAIQERVLEGQRRVQGADHPHTLGAMTNLAQLLEDQNQLPEAQAMLQSAVEGWRRAHGAEHPGTLQAMSNLASLLLRMGKAADAEGLALRTLEARTRILGAQHPDTIATLGNLGLIQFRTGRISEAEETLSKAWQAGRAALGEGHSDVLTVAVNLATLYEGRGWPESARPQLEGLVKTLGTVAANPAATPNDLNAAAWTLLTIEPETLRDPQAALKASARSCDLERKAGGGELWQYLDTLALAHFQCGSPLAAAEHQEEAISLLPASGESYRGEMEERLRQYRAAGGAPGGG